MPQDMKVWRTNATRKLKISLGGECVDCGKDDLEKLTIEHIEPLTEEQSIHRSKIGRNSRLVLYRKEAKEGLLTLLCQRCQLVRNKTMFTSDNNPRKKTNETPDCPY
mgnify:CR=1 FL=1